MNNEMSEHNYNILCSYIVYKLKNNETIAQKFLDYVGADLSRLAKEAGQ